MKILLAVDGSRYSNEAARRCREMIDGFAEAHVLIVTVAEGFAPLAAEPYINPEELIAEIEREVRENAERIVSETLEIVRNGSSAEGNIETRILEGSPKKLIVAEAEEWGADLIVVGSHGYGFWGRALIGSVSDAVVHHAPCSVLIVKTG